MWWETLGIEETHDETKINDAYESLKSNLALAENPEQFKRIRDAYRMGISVARSTDQKSISQQKSTSKPRSSVSRTSDTLGKTDVKATISSVENKTTIQDAFTDHYGDTSIQGSQDFLDGLIPDNDTRTLSHFNLNDQEIQESYLLSLCEILMSDCLLKGTKNQNSWSALLELIFLNPLDNHEELAHNFIAFLHKVDYRSIHYGIRATTIIPGLKRIMDSSNEPIIRRNLDNIINRACIRYHIVAVQRSSFDTVWNWRYHNVFQTSTKFYEQAFYWITQCMKWFLILFAVFALVSLMFV